ncbi:hypothetical protein [Shewanella surugensis]|uniref:Uncharacterized protein n=1 Tax=Shewanella surugensis TaxID=212020 RepID=A0ABT0L8L3_9GAMM|nr:hypothetical protein [Shewanella surugensis]MCL1123840.1 hypothetical protein [Shewanella surugensis]
MDIDDTFAGDNESFNEQQTAGNIVSSCKTCDFSAVVGRVAVLSGMLIMSQ